MMVLSVSLYAIFGAIVIRKLESKEVTNSNVIMKRATNERSVRVRVINDTIGPFSYASVDDQRGNQNPFLEST